MHIPRTVLLLAFVFGTTTLLAACFGRGKEASAPIDLTPTTLDYAVFNLSSRAREAEEAVIQGFEEVHPVIEVERNVLNQAPLSALTGSQVPDVMMIVSGNMFSVSMEQGLLTDVGEIWEQAELPDLHPALQELGRREGKRYYLPTSYGWTGFYYNRQIFQRYGLQPPGSWNEFLQICQTLWDRGEIPLSWAGNDFFLAGLWFDYLTLRLNGPDFYQALNAGQIPFDDLRVRAVLETWLSLFEHGYISREFSTSNALDSMTALVREDGETPLSRYKAVMGLAALPTVADLPVMFQEELGFFPFPEMDTTQPTGEIVFSLGYVVPAQADDRLQALAFLAYLISQDAQATFMRHYGRQAPYVPLRTDLAPDLFSSDQIQGMAMVQEASVLVSPSPLIMPEPISAAFGRMVRAFQREEPDLDGILADLEEARQKFLFSQP